MMSRKGPWEGYNLLPAFLCAHILIERETSGYEADRVSMARLETGYPLENSRQTDKTS